MKIKTLSTLAGVLLSFSATSHAQSPLLGSLPIVGDLLGGDLLGDLPIVGDLLGGLPILGSLSLEGLPIAPGQQLGGLLTLGTGVLGDPAILTSIIRGTGIPLVQELVPVVGVLTDEPLSLPGYLLGGGGSVLTPSLSALLPIPLLVAPL